MKRMFDLTKNFKKNFFVATAFVLSFLFLVCLNALGAPVAMAYNEPSGIFVENGTFESYTVGSTGLPYSIENKGWTLVKDNNVLAGVIDVSASGFLSQNKFTLDENPQKDTYLSSDDNFVFMFKQNGSGNGKASLKSTPFKLEANACYDIFVHAKSTNSAQGSIFVEFGGVNLSQENTNKTAIYSVAPSAWNTFHFFVKTDEISSVSTTLSLRFGADKNLGSSGEMFFDNVTINRISEDVFEQTYNALEEDEDAFFNQKKAIDLTRDVVSPRSASIGEAQNFANSKFENNLDGWEVVKTDGEAECFAGVLLSEEIYSKLDNLGFDVATNVAKTNMPNNTSSLLIANKNCTTQTVKSISTNNLIVAQHGFYKLSMLVKTGNVSGTGLVVTLTPKNTDVDAVSQTVTTANAIEANNNFCRVEFFVKGSSRVQEEVAISFALGGTSGWAVVDEISLTPISSSEYSVDSENKLDLSTTLDNTENINNSMFEFVTTQSHSLVYPLAPQDWTYEGESTLQSGVIRINPIKFEKDKAFYGYPENPGYNTEKYSSPSSSDLYNENVLMIRNNSSHQVYYTSSTTKSIDSTSKVCFEVGVKTTQNAKAFVRVVDANGIVVGEIDEINTFNLATSSSSWQTKKIFVVGGLGAITVHLELGMESATASDFVFFDCADFSSSVSQTKDEILSDSNATYVNLSQNSFSNHSNKVIDEKIFKTNDFSVVESSGSVGTVFGVIDTKSNANLNVRDEADDSFVLVIKNNLDYYQTLQTAHTYSLTQNNYYEISVYIKTDFSNATLNEEGNFGVEFELVGLDSDGNFVDRSENKNKFSKIVVSSTDDSGWIKYSMFVLCEETQNVKVLLGLGTTTSLTQGLAYFDDLKVESISEEVYASKKADDTTIVSKVIEIPSSNVGPTPSPAPSYDSQINVWALASSIILVVALALAIAGYLIRKLPKRKEAKVAQSTYAKSARAVNKVDVERDTMQHRKESLTSLSHKIEELTKQQEDLKAQYEQAHQDEASFDTGDYKTFKKQSNKLQAQIEYLSSAIAYLNNGENTKITQKREIRKRKKQNKKDFDALKQKK